MGDSIHRRLAAILAVLGCMLFASAAQPDTPDGNTPAEESVCDGEVGALFGLCNAYCEAMDCDSDDSHASDQACGRVLAHFEKKSGGRPPPCTVECPCFSEDSLFAAVDSVLDQGLLLAACGPSPSPDFVGFLIFAFGFSSEFFTALVLPNANLCEVAGQKVDVDLVMGTFTDLEDAEVAECIGVIENVCE